MKKRLVVFIQLVIIIDFVLSASFEQEKVVSDYIEQIDANKISDISFLKKYFDEESKMIWMFHKKPEIAKGIESIKNNIADCFKKCPEGKHKIVDLISKGNVIFVEGISYGKFTNGKEYRLPYLAKFVMKVNLIKKIVVYSDFGSYFKEAGQTSEL
jgi:hypothetical protein